MNTRRILYWALGILAFFLISSLLFYNFWFLRDPDRTIPSGDVLVSPADGTVVRLFSLPDPGHIGIEKGILGEIQTTSEDVADSVNVMVIMMTPLDVHYQRSPISGEVVTVEYVEGEFVNAVSNAESLVAYRNEKNEILIQGEFKVKVIQVAGVLARRIVDYVDEGSVVERGEKVGLIKLGSMVVMIFPEDLDPEIEEGEYVYGGETIVARY